MDRHVVVILDIPKEKRQVDIDIPLDLTANELVTGLNQAYGLGIDVADVKKSYLRTENPFALLRGNKLLEEFGIHQGTIIHCEE